MVHSACDSQIKMETQLETRSGQLRLRAGGWVESLLLFGLPGLLLLFTFEWLNPWLQSQNVPLVWSFTLSLYGPLFLTGVMAIIAYRLEGNRLTWPAFRDRMRLNKMPSNQRGWWWAIGALFIVLLGEGLLASTGQWLASMPFFAPPPMLPALIDPNQAIPLPPSDYFGVPLAGNGWVIGLYALSLLINIGCEELLWRGYLLPRQEAVFGRWAWLVNSLMWVFLLHAMMRWNWIILLPTGLLTPFIAQRFKNSWPAVLIHGFGNGIFLLLIIFGVLTG